MRETVCEDRFVICRRHIGLEESCCQQEMFVTHKMHKCWVAVLNA